MSSTSSPPALDAGTANRLDLHEVIAHTPVTGCDRWPEPLRLLASDGTLVKGRCRATNLCRYCQSLYVIETVEALTLDALGGNAPTLWLVLTAREHLSRPDLNEHLRTVRQAMKRRGWDFEWFVQVEFQRRGALHANLLVKGVPAEQQGAFAAELFDRWVARVDAELVGQWFGAVADALAVSKYVSKMLAHGLKSEQAPPLGWKGHRTSHTRGYFGEPMWRVRERAQASLRSKRALWRAQAAGYSGSEAELIAEADVLRSGSLRWECVVVSQKVDGSTGEIIGERYRGLRGGSPEVKLRAIRERRAARRVSDNELYVTAVREAAAALLPLTERHSVPAEPTAALFTLSVGEPFG